MSLRNLGNRLLRDASHISTLKSSITLLRKTSKLEKYFICTNGGYSNPPLSMKRTSYALLQSHELAEMNRLRRLSTTGTDVVVGRPKPEIYRGCDMQKKKRLFFVFNASSNYSRLQPLTSTTSIIYYIHFP